MRQSQIDPSLLDGENLVGWYRRPVDQIEAERAVRRADRHKPFFANQDDLAPIPSNEADASDAVAPEPSRAGIPTISCLKRRGRAVAPSSEDLPPSQGPRRARQFGRPSGACPCLGSQRLSPIGGVKLAGPIHLLKSRAAAATSNLG